MRRSKRFVLLGVTVAVIGLASLLVAGTALASGPWGGMGGMMGGYGWPAAGYNGGVGGQSGGYGMPCGGGWGTNTGTTPTGQAISLDQAVANAQNYVKAGGNSDLLVTEVLDFQYNFYAMVKEQSTGVFAYELLIDKYSGAVYPEMGPNMMWNTKYGHMAGWGRGGMMGGWWNGQNQSQTPAGQMTVTADQAKQAAQQYLDANFPGTAAEDIGTFYGYYTIHFTKDGKVAGMLSVNGYTSAVWYHSWHGDFIQEKSVS